MLWQARLTENVQKYVLVFRHLGLITSCPRWALVFHEKIGNNNKVCFCTTRLPSGHRGLLVVLSSLLVFSSSLASTSLFSSTHWFIFLPCFLWKIYSSELSAVFISFYFNIKIIARASFALSSWISHILSLCVFIISLLYCGHRSDIFKKASAMFPDKRHLALGGAWWGTYQ